MSNIFTKRVAFKPFEYPEVIAFKDAISESYWLASEWNFISDIHDFNTALTPQEREIIKRSMLAISQIEVSVKEFWAKLGDKFPKAEFKQVGITFGENEVRHADLYSHLLQLLGLNADFELLLQEPCIQGRVDYLTKYLKNASDSSNENYTLTLTLFSLFIENVSLFSQFVIIKSFNKHKNLFKDIDNGVQATAQEENVHFELGVYLINKIKEENPEWFNSEFYEKIYRAAKKAYKAECGILDWIFQNGDIDIVKKEEVQEFIKNRINNSLLAIGANKVFDVNEEVVSKFKWFDEELRGKINFDFFNKKSTDYAKRQRSVTAEDLF